MSRSQRLIEDRLRDALGDGLLTQEPLRHHTTFRIGGPADFYYAAPTAGKLVSALATAHAAELPVFLLGGGSNLLGSDEGFRGLVIRHAIENIEFDGSAAHAAESPSPSRARATTQTPSAPSNHESTWYARMARPGSPAATSHATSGSPTRPAR